MDVNKVLYVSQEIEPYLSATPLSTFGRTLPQSIQEKGAEVRTFMPRYGAINERRNQLHEVIRLSGMNIIIDDTDHPLIIKVATLQPTRMQVYFIDNDDFFNRHTSKALLETESDKEHNDERTMFFVRGVIETVKKLRWEPSIVHCTGWITALVPLYLKTIYYEDPSFRASKVVYSLFDQTLDETLNDGMLDKLRQEGFSDDDLKQILTNEGKVDYKTLNKIAIDFADAIVQSTEEVDSEILEYAKKSGKPFLPFPTEETPVDSYYQFYQSL